MFPHDYFASTAAILSRGLFRSSCLFMFRVGRVFYCQHSPGEKNKQKTGHAVAESAASGAAEPVATQVQSAVSPGPVPITQLLEMNTRQGSIIDAYLSIWAAQMKAYVDVKLMCFLKEHAASSIRFAMHHQHMSGSRTWDAEASVRVIRHLIESSWRDL